MQSAAIIPGRFNGPPDSGNGGYSCGVLAAYITGPARVRLHVPPPLDRALRISAAEGGGVSLYDGETLVGSAEPAALQLDVPAPPSPEEALAAMSGFPWYEGHAFPTCFVCGPGRSQHDGLALFPGPLAEAEIHACLWRPAADLLDIGGNIRPEILWAALDCPGYFAAMDGQSRPALLGELAGELHSAASGADALVVYAWPLGSEGRKFYAGTAIATARGEVVARARSTWIVLRA